MQFSPWPWDEFGSKLPSENTSKIKMYVKYDILISLTWTQLPKYSNLT